MTKSKLQIIKEKKLARELEAKKSLRLELPLEQIRMYDWGSKDFRQNLKNKSATVKKLLKQEYWLLIEVRYLSHIVSDVSIVKRATLENESLIRPIQYIYAGSENEKILKIKKKKLMLQLEENNNRVRFI